MVSGRDTTRRTYPSRPALPESAPTHRRTARHIGYRGSLAEHTAPFPGSRPPLPVRDLAHRKGVKGWRWYHIVEIPCGNGNHNELIPVYETQEDSTIDPRTKRKKFNRTEHLRQIPPHTHLGDRLKGFRQDSESSNCTLDYSHWDKRLPAYGADGALLMYLGYAWVINSIALATANNP
ncbi:hypothetical protein ACFWGI_33495 [Streptomyces niveus]|uniref:hypothetical protein n=1 Tax=Streptomyces niveus TaxID=193462 RepID=UPI003651CB02